MAFTGLYPDHRVTHRGSATVLRDGAISLSPFGIPTLRDVSTEGRNAVDGMMGTDVRPTMDIDLLGRTSNEAETIVRQMREVVQLGVPNDDVVLPRLVYAER
jgi:hypothetical protein